MKRIARKLFPKLYLFLALVKYEVYDEYMDLKKNNLCMVSFYKYIINYFFYGTTPIEFNFLNFRNLNRFGKNNFVTMRRNRKIEKYNDPKAKEILCAKEKFNNYFSEFIKRKWIYITPETTYAEIENFYNSLTEKKFIIKPNSKYYGLGISIGTTMEELKEQIKVGEIIIEEVVKNHEYIAQLNPTSLNTIRVVTAVDNNNIPHIVAMALRTGGKGEVIDNARGGGSFYHIDKETGIVDSQGYDTSCNSYILHPTSNIVMPGYKIPRFEEVIQYSKKLALKLPKARFVGWDIAVTDDGIEVIEGNHAPGANVMQSDKVGVYKNIKRYLEN